MSPTDPHDDPVGLLFDAYAASDDPGLAFESARDDVRRLGPQRLSDVLARAAAPARDTDLELAVWVLADTLYPPAWAWFRHWLGHPDLEQIALPSASALDQLMGSPIGTDTMWRADTTTRQQMIAATAQRWDAGGAPPIPDRDAWLADQRVATPQPEPGPTAAPQDDPGPTAAPQHDPGPAAAQPEAAPVEEDPLRPAIAEMVELFRTLPVELQHRVDYDGINHVVHLYDRAFPDGAVLKAALEAVDALLDGRVTDPSSLAGHAEAVRPLVSRANEAAGWNAATGRFENPKARAAGQVAQGVLYVCSPEPRNRLQGLHWARDALESSGAGFAGVRLELEWQRRRVDDAARR